MRSRRPDPRRRPRRAGFSLLELVLVVILISILAGSLAPSLASRRAEARDARRLADLHVLVGAVEQHRLEHGEYPAGTPSPGHDGWDVSHEGGFLPELAREGFLREPLFDPLNDEQHHYAYRLYPADSQGCVGGPFYVLGIRRLETEKHARHRRGIFRCGQRDWGLEFAYVTGGGARAR
jgi:prepilin-type N-terminal cleavage/methylation domain-containing protein